MGHCPVSRSTISGFLPRRSVQATGPKSLVRARRTQRSLPVLLFVVNRYDYTVPGRIRPNLGHAAHIHTYLVRSSSLQYWTSSARIRSVFTSLHDLDSLHGCVIRIAPSERYPSCSQMLPLRCYTTQVFSDTLLSNSVPGVWTSPLVLLRTFYRHGYLRKSRLVQNLPAFGTILVSFLWVCNTGNAPTAQSNPSFKLKPRPPCPTKEHSMKDLNVARLASHWGHKRIFPAMGASGQWMQVIWSQWAQAKVGEEEKESKKDLPHNAWSAQSVATS
ncbi:hypothetical protein BDP81DRAFT_417668 [Colletotrichum phormii]|uniref:Uncharacterized protein n=1 Tax=Colletotrichum phormii TaxID=359342 RepID=A0AAI9ZZZ8_9PEZI|nr:uncharacterized protein BDP81DRAFT_417668 [Colletotrichum phormii]KAK1640920.1 hypothetical protein BDP81DRAFT_417668 [Colletotrichum phormii]